MKCKTALLRAGITGFFMSMGIPLTLSSCAAQSQLVNSQKEPVVHLSVVEGAEASGKQYSAKVFREGTAEYEGFPNANVKVRGMVSYKLPIAGLRAGPKAKKETGGIS
jgi:hypothetical protein